MKLGKLTLAFNTHTKYYKLT